MCVCFFFACFHAVRYILPRNYLTDLSFDFIPKVSYSTPIVNLHYHKMQLTWHEHDLVFSIHLVVALTNKKDCKSNKNDEHVMHARNWKLKFFWLITLTVVYMYSLHTGIFYLIFSHISKSHTEFGLFNENALRQTGLNWYIRFHVKIIRFIVIWHHFDYELWMSAKVKLEFQKSKNGQLDTKRHSEEA